MMCLDKCRGSAGCRVCRETGVLFCWETRDLPVKERLGPAKPYPSILHLPRVSLTIAPRKAWNITGYIHTYCDSRKNARPYFYAIGLPLVGRQNGLSLIRRRGMRLTAEDGSRGAIGVYTQAFEPHPTLNSPKPKFG